MNKAQKHLLDNNLSDIVVNADSYPKNTPENAKLWVYMSDVMERFSRQNQGQELPIHNVSNRLDEECYHCKSELYTELVPICKTKGCRYNDY